MAERLMRGGVYEIDPDWIISIQIPEHGATVILDLKTVKDVLRVALWMHSKELPWRELEGVAPIDEVFMGLPPITKENENG